MLRQILLLSLLVTAALPVSGQTSGGPFLEDPTGDVAATAADSRQAAPSYFAFLDLKDITIQEDRDSFTFTLGVDDLNSATDPAWNDGGIYEITFAHADRAFKVEVGTCAFCLASDYAWASFYSRAVDSPDWTREWTRSDSEGPRIDKDADTVAQRIPKADLRDSSGAKPATGRSLSDLVAISMSGTSDWRIEIDSSTPSVDPPLVVADRMPDEGAALPWPVQFGAAQTGAARLNADQPMRASNGEATTIIYTVTASNVGDKAQLFELEAMGAPSTWNVVLPVAALQLEPGEQRDIPVLVTTPFRHLHGAEETFHVHMTSPSDPKSVGRVELGIVFNAVPQPAGHHSQIWFHSIPSDEAMVPSGQVFAGGGDRTFFNALEVDEQDAGEPVSGFNWGMRFDGGVGSETRWYLPLSPGLRMGLDFDLSRVGAISVPIQAPAGLAEAQLSGRIILLGSPTEDGFSRFYGDRLATELANFTTQPVEIGMGETHDFIASIVASPEADYIPYDPANDLALELSLVANQPKTFTVADAPLLMPGGTAVLPLSEYHDPVDDVFGSLQGPVLQSVGAQKRLVNPGAMAIFEVEVQNANDNGATFLLEVSGPHAQWANLGQTQVKLTPGGTGTIQVAIQVPVDARDGELADLVLTAEDQADPASRGLIRLVAEVDQDLDHADDAAVLSSVDKQSPGPSALLVVALAVLLARRRL